MLKTGVVSFERQGHYNMQMQKPLLILLHLLLSFSTTEKAAYEVIFAEDYKSALNYLRQNSQAFKASASTYGHSPELLTSIVFPELVRYSIISDLVETSALEYIYLSGGSGAADFSIGRFQMKQTSGSPTLSKSNTHPSSLIRLTTHSGNVPGACSD